VACSVCGKAFSFKVRFILEFCHGVPIPFRHIVHPQTWIFPLLDGNGIIEAFPKETVVGLTLVRWSHLEALDRANDCFPASIKQCFFVGAVIDKKRILTIPGTKMSAKKGKDAVFRLDLAA
jgi:hypothetical protein